MREESPWSSEETGMDRARGAQGGQTFVAMLRGVEGSRHLGRNLCVDDLQSEGSGANKLPSKQSVLLGILA